MKGQDDLRNTQLMLIYTGVEYFNSWDKLPLNNRRTSKALKFNLKFNCQLSKLEKSNGQGVKATTPSRPPGLGLHGLSVPVIGKWWEQITNVFAGLHAL